MLGGQVAKQMSSEEAKAADHVTKFLLSGPSCEEETRDKSLKMFGNFSTRRSEILGSNSQQLNFGKGTIFLIPELLFQSHDVKPLMLGPLQSSGPVYLRRSQGVELCTILSFQLFQP